MNSAGDEINRKHRFLGLLLIPFLVFSNAVLAVSWEVQENTCSLDESHTASGSITLDGVEYDLYSFGYDDLEADSQYEEEGCRLTDFTIRTADEIDLLVRTSGYSVKDACSLEGDSRCDGAIVQGGTRWIPMGYESHRESLFLVKGYLAFDDGGWFGDGSFLLAVEPVVEVTDFEVDVRPYEPYLALFLSILTTPAVLWFVNRWAKTNHQPHLQSGAMVLVSNVLKVGVVHGFSLTCLILLGDSLSDAAPFVFGGLFLLAPSVLVYAERKHRLSRVFAWIFGFLLVPLQVMLLLVAGRGGPLGCQAFFTSPEMNPLETHPSLVYYIWLASHLPLLWHYLTAHRLQHPLLYTLAIPVLFVFLVDMSISHTAMLAGVGGSIEGCSEYQDASIRYTIGLASLLTLAGTMTWARRYHGGHRNDSLSTPENSVGNVPMTPEETLRHAQAMGLELSPDGTAWVPSSMNHPPGPKP